MVSPMYCMTGGEKLFGDTLKWDDRGTNRSSRQADLTHHKVTQQLLWLDSPHNPSRDAEQHRLLGGTADPLSPSLIWACCKTKDLSRGSRLHHELQKRGLIEKNYSDALVTMYAKCDEIQKAQILLDKHNSTSIIPWTALIAGYARQGQGQNALDCFERMQYENIPPNSVTYACILKACAMSKALDKGKLIHYEISKQGLLECDIVLSTALLDMYAKCGALPQAHGVLEKLPFRDVISWNALIAGYAGNGQGQQALQCFQQMQREGILPNAVTYICILKGCAAIGALDRGKQIHDEVLKKGFLEHNIILGSALVDMYAKCGTLSQAQSVLEKLPSRNVVSWNALIAGHAQNGQGHQALECFEQMQCEGILPDAVTYACILKACAWIGARDKGKQIHEEVSKQGLLKHNIMLGNALVDMYAKCGALPFARSVLEELPTRDVVSWSALITGYVQEGQCQQALECFKCMQDEGVLPDAVTFLCLLKLCSHLGLVEKSLELFDSMEAVYGLKPDVECVTCMVDILGRAGHLVRAVEVVQRMPFYANSAIWHCLLGACWKWLDVNVGTWAFEQAVELDKCDGAAYVLMENIYAAAGMQEQAKDIEATRKENKALTPSGCSSWINSNNVVQEFGIDETKHAKSTDIDLKQDIAHRMLQQGYFSVPQGMDDGSKAQLFCCHLEKLVLPQEDDMTIRTNMQMCGNRHTVISYV